MVAAAEASALSMVPSPISPTAGSGAGFMNLTRSAATAGAAAVDRRPSVFETSASPVNRRPSVMPVPLNRSAGSGGDDDTGPSNGHSGAVHHVRKASMQPAAMGLAAIGEMEVSVNAHTYSAAEAGSSSDGAAPASIEQQLAALLDLKLPAVPTLATWLSTPGQGLGYSVSAPLAPADVSAVEGDKNRQLWLTAVEAEKIIAWGMCCLHAECMYMMTMHPIDCVHTHPLMLALLYVPVSAQLIRSRPPMRYGPMWVEASVNQHRTII